MKKTEKIFSYVNRWNEDLAMTHFSMTKRKIRQYYLIGKKSIYEAHILKSKQAYLAAAKAVLSELDMEITRKEQEIKEVTIWSFIWRGI